MFQNQFPEISRLLYMAEVPGSGPELPKNEGNSKPKEDPQALGMKVIDQWGDIYRAEKVKTPKPIEDWPDKGDSKSKPKPKPSPKPKPKPDEGDTPTPIEDW